MSSKKQRIKAITSRAFKLFHRYGFAAALLLLAAVTIQAIIVRQTQTGADLGQTAPVVAASEPALFFLPGRLPLKADEKDALSLILSTPGGKFSKAEIDLSAVEPAGTLSGLSLADSETAQIERSGDLITIQPNSGTTLADGQELIASLPVDANTPDILIPASAIKFVSLDGAAVAPAEAATFFLAKPEASDAG